MSGAGPVLVAGEPPRIGRFRIAARIGTGSASHVYLAMDTREGSWRALKVLAFEKMGDERARARFRRECEAAVGVNHPHLLTAFDAGDDPYTPWVSLEVCEAGSLADWVERRGPMPPYLAIEVMVQVCSGLAAAHRACIAQRRLEARDILVDRHGKCRLTDFRPVSGPAGGLGSDAIDLRDDVVAAGNVLHFLLTGRPYAEGQPMNGIPDALQGIVVRAMQRGRGQGYPDAAAMGRDLEAAMLEVSLPVGAMATLVDGDVALPDTVEELFDPEATFEDLERAARWAADPEAGPQKVERASDLMALLGNSGAPRSEPAARPLGYTMPSMTPAPVSPHRKGKPGAAKPGPRRPAANDNSSHERDVLAAAPFQRVTPGPALYHTSPHGRITPPGSGAPPAAKNRTVTPAPVPRGRPGEYRPDYIVDEPTAGRDESWRTATPEPVQRVAAPKETKVDPRLVVLGLAVLFVLLISLVGKGAYDVKQARLVADDAGENLTAIVEAEAAVVGDLAARGGDRQLLEQRFFAYRESRGDARYRAADAFAAAVLAEAEEAGIDATGPVKDSVTQRVSAVGDARARYLRERQVWADTAGRFPGVLPVLIGLSGSPQPSSAP